MRLSIFRFVALLLFVLPASFAVAQCTLDQTDPSVTICQPADGALVTSPVHVVAGSHSTSPVTVMQIYVDQLKVYEVKTGTIDTNLTMTNGTHRFTVQGKNQAGAVFKKTIFITVSASSNPGLSNLKHIIFYMQENRPFDQYFGRMGQYRRDRGVTDSFDDLPLTASLPDYNDGRHVSPYHIPTACHENLSPGWNESHFTYHNGADDYVMKASGSLPSSIDPQGTRAMSYYDWNDLPYYYELAFQYGTSDRWFSSVMAPTVPNRMYLFTGTSFGHIRPDAAPSGGWTQKTIFRALTEAGVSWKYYYQDSSVFLSEFADWTTQQGKVVNISNYYTDLQNGTLPSVVFIERPSQLGLDEHPTKNIQKGAANTKTIMDALMASSAWSSSAFILTYDEAGGFYDHVDPQPATPPDGIAPMWRTTDIKANFDQTGFRVPLIVVSPWAKQHFVSHVVRDNTAILKLIETRFGVPALTARDAAQDDMTEFFDFVNPPHLTIPALPAQPTNLPCSYSMEKAPGF